MGNAGSSSMHQRERQKSADLSTPSSPYREVVGGVAVSTGGSGAGSGSGSSGSGSGSGNTTGQIFSFEKRGRDAVLQAGSSQEDEETVSEPYYTKPIVSKAVGVMATTTTTTSTVNAGANNTNTSNTRAVSGGGVSSAVEGPTSNQTEFDVIPLTRKRSLTISEGQQRAVAEQQQQQQQQNDGHNKNESSLGSSEKRNSKEEEEKAAQKNMANPALPTVLRWDGGGKNVMISGTFSKWKPIPMVRSHGNFVTIIDLPEGDHQYKFCVDGEWKHDPKLKSIENSQGDTNNLVSVRQSDFEVFQALAKDGEQGVSNAEREYSQEVPQVKPWDKVNSGPPILPPHLLQVILNKDTPLSCEPTLLPEPNHVMLNHLYALSIKDGVMVLSATHRYRKKYVTTLLYKPI